MTPHPFKVDPEGRVRWACAVIGTDFDTLFKRGPKGKLSRGKCRPLRAAVWALCRAKSKQDMGVTPSYNELAYVCGMSASWITDAVNELMGRKPGTIGYKNRIDRRPP